MIYLDHNATSPLLPEVLETMLPWLGVPANPSSVHRFGQRAAMALEEARRDIAEFLGRPAAGMVFTSGTTEANQAWFYGIEALGHKAVAVGALEHPCVWGAARRSGLVIHTMGAGRDGRVRLIVPSDCDAVCLMAANHETGVLQDLQAAFATGLPVHVDATQAVGRVRLPFTKAYSVAISGHKLGGPSGIGVLSLRGDDDFPPLLAGGSQERGRRAGTVNVAGAVGLAAACRVAARDLDERTQRWTVQQAWLEQALVALGARIVGAEVPRLPQTTCAVFAGMPNELIVQAADLGGVAISAGAACASGSTEPSPVLKAMGDPDAGSGIRISQGPATTMDELKAAVQRVGEVVDAWDCA